MFIIEKVKDGPAKVSDLHMENTITLFCLDPSRVQTLLDSAIELTNKELAKRIREVFSEVPHGEEFAKLVEQGSIIPKTQVWTEAKPGEWLAPMTTTNEGSVKAAQEMVNRMLSPAPQPEFEWPESGRIAMTEDWPF